MKTPDHLQRQLQSICQSLQEQNQRYDKLQHEDVDLSTPGLPASLEAITQVEAHFDFQFPPDYRAFLQLHNGWKRFSLGQDLLSMEELLSKDSQEDIDFLLELEEENDRPLGKVFVFGRAHDNATMIFFDPASQKPDGTLEVVEYLYEELVRYPNFIAYLESEVEKMKELADFDEKLLTDTEMGKDPIIRLQIEQELIQKLIKRLQSEKEHVDPKPFEPAKIFGLTKKIAQAQQERPTAPTDLILYSKDKPTQTAADVRLGLCLFLQFPPTSEEMQKALRAYRTHFPWQGPVLAWQAQRFDFGSNHKLLAHPEDESSFKHLLSDSGILGFYGINWVESPDRTIYHKQLRSFCIRSIPEAEGRPSVSLCKIFLPPDADAQKLKVLALELADILPIASGYAGFMALWSKTEGMSSLSTWSKRYLGLDVESSNGLFPQMKESIKGANWLTLVGNPFVVALQQIKGKDIFSFSDPQISIFVQRKVLAIQAGAVPTLGDVYRGEFPILYAEVEKVISLLKPQKPADMGTTFYTYFWTQWADSTWYQRLLDPEAWLSPQGEDLIKMLQEQMDQGKEEELPETLKELKTKKLSDSEISQMCTAGYRALQAGFLSFAQDLFEHTLMLPHPPKMVYTNLLYIYLLAQNLEKAKDVIENYLQECSKEPLFLYNCACVYIRCGEKQKTLAFLKQAKEAGYKNVDQMKTDPDFASLAQEPQFQDLLLASLS